MSLNLALMVLDHIERAERAYADVLDASREAPWIHEIAFVEHHRHDRIVVRGTFAGRYASPEHVGAMVAASEGRGGRLVRHHLSPQAAQALEGAVVGSTQVPPSTGE
jgi:hypothetical protein